MTQEWSQEAWGLPMHALSATEVVLPRGLRRVRACVRAGSLASQHCGAGFLLQQQRSLGSALLGVAACPPACCHGRGVLAESARAAHVDRSSPCAWRRRRPWRRCCPTASSTYGCDAVRGDSPQARLPCLVGGRRAVTAGISGSTKLFLSGKWRILAGNKAPATAWHSKRCSASGHRAVGAPPVWKPGLSTR